MTNAGHFCLGSIIAKDDGNYVDIFQDGSWVMSFNFGKDYRDAVRKIERLQQAHGMEVQ